MSCGVRLAEGHFGFDGDGGVLLVALEELVRGLVEEAGVAYDYWEGDVEDAEVVEDFRTVVD